MIVNCNTRSSRSYRSHRARVKVKQLFMLYKRDITVVFPFVFELVNRVSIHTHFYVGYCIE